MGIKVTKIEGEALANLLKSIVRDEKEESGDEVMTIQARRARLKELVTTIDDSDHRRPLKTGDLVRLSKLGEVVYDGPLADPDLQIMVVRVFDGSTIDRSNDVVNGEVALCCEHGTIKKIPVDLALFVKSDR